MATPTLPRPDDPFLVPPGSPGPLANRWGQAPGTNASAALAACIAHEVSQPLSGILTNASACLRMLHTNPPNVEAAVETMHRTLRDVDRASAIVRQLRSLFVKSAVPSEAVDIDDVIREAVALMQCDLDRYGITVVLALGDRLPLVVGDRVGFQQVMLNLVRNGCDAMRALDRGPRQLSIATALDADRHVEVVVRDSGTGFAAQDAERLFAPFYTTKVHGMGIGLSVGRSIIEGHGGRLWGAPNGDGCGATFFLRIPCVSPFESAGETSTARISGES